MIARLFTYLGCLFQILRKKEGRKLIISELDFIAYRKAYTEQVDQNKKWKALEQSTSWLKHSQDNMLDDGFGTYYLCSGWTSSYPETSGYIIPTLLRYAQHHQDADVLERAQHGLNWLLNIQKPEGGWQSGYVDQDRDAIVFNTGQVIRGMVAGYAVFQNEEYLDAARKAADWLVSIQDQSGAFNKHVYLDQARVYESYSVAPVLELNQFLQKEQYVSMAERNAEWIINEKQLKNGWFTDCDNTVHKNHKPITHTIAYTVDGLIDIGRMLKRQDIIDAAVKPAELLRDEFLRSGTLAGRYDQNWKGSESFITTGGAQFAIIWHKLHALGNDAKYKEAAERMNSFLTALQLRSIEQSSDTKGALFGSFPMWGRYESFGCPNWATKYFADSLMNEAGYEEIY